MLKHAKKLENFTYAAIFKPVNIKYEKKYSTESHLQIKDS